MDVNDHNKIINDSIELASYLRSLKEEGRISVAQELEVAKQFLDLIKNEVFYFKDKKYYKN